MLLGSVFSSSRERPKPRHKPRLTAAGLGSLVCCSGVDWRDEGDWICEAGLVLGFRVWIEELEGDDERGQPEHVQA